MKPWRPEEEYFQSAQRKKCQPRFLYPVKLSFINEGEIKTCQNKQKLRIYCQWTTLQEILREVL